MAHLAVLGLVVGGSLFAFSSSVAGAGAPASRSRQQVKADCQDQDSGQPTETAPFPPPADEDCGALVNFTKSGPASAVAGTNITYTIHVEHGVPAGGDFGDVGAITVIDTFPAGTTFVSSSGTGWTCTPTATTLTCTHPGPFLDHDPTQPADITVTVLIPSSLGGTTIRNCASATAVSVSVPNTPPDACSTTTVTKPTVTKAAPAVPARPAFTG